MRLRQQIIIAATSAGVIFTFMLCWMAYFTYRPTEMPNTATFTAFMGVVLLFWWLVGSMVAGVRGAPSRGLCHVFGGGRRGSGLSASYEVLSPPAPQARPAARWRAAREAGSASHGYGRSGWRHAHSALEQC